jgi:uncharacterized protein involved in response to NO
MKGSFVNRAVWLFLVLYTVFVMALVANLAFSIAGRDEFLHRLVVGAFGCLVLAVIVAVLMKHEKEEKH